MYALNFVRKRQRRIIAAIVGGVGVTGVTTLSIAAFLGHQVGSFTVSLESKSAQLTLSETSDFKERSSFLRIDEVPEFHEFTYRNIKDLGDEVIDSEETNSTLGIKTTGKGESATDFLKYTFFLKNVGTDSARFDFSLQIKEMVASSQGLTFEDSFRVMVYEDGKDTVYAKKLAYPHEGADGENDFRAPISVDKSDATSIYPFEGYAESFVSSTEVMSKKGIELDVGEVKRYTVVTWLEGFRSSGDASAYEGASIKLGVEINAYEN